MLEWGLCFDCMHLTRRVLSWCSGTTGEEKGRSSGKQREKEEEIDVSDYHGLCYAALDRSIRCGWGSIWWGGMLTPRKTTLSPRYGHTYIHTHTCKHTYRYVLMYTYQIKLKKTSISLCTLWHCCYLQTLRTPQLTQTPARQQQQLLLCWWRWDRTSVSYVCT